ncbi:pseudouridine synthase [Sphingomonas bacterium]|uniref:pseudouridine synthase n=1 Tax=Sphingomonas bacterium TaxID=1895847 RepID=UPI00263207E9|nr:pseudouridine synthase [Sphingomonas bacterium]MDB5679715.1 pseudouridine synthase [Sphingomonas bacterium]
MPVPNTPANKSDDQRIAKLLARAGVASRREVERMIADGRVALNGFVIDTPATLLASLDGVTVDDNPVEAPSAARLFLYHKPPGLLVTERDPAGRPTIYDRLPRDLPRVVPVGRLDLNTEGLLLLTTDGGLKRQLELPVTGVERAYRARAYGNVTQAQLEDLIEGVEIEGVRYGSIDANLERRTGANVWVEMILTEGKNREVRRVLEHLGLQVSRLIRTRYGPFVLGDLPPGRVGEVRPHDVESFRKSPTRIDLPQPARSREAGVKAVEPRPASKPAPRDVKPKREPERPSSRPNRPAPSRTPARSLSQGDASGGASAPNDRSAQRSRPAPTTSPNARGSSRPARPGKPAKAPRQRADGSLAVKAGSSSPARAARARTFRDDRGSAPARPSAPGRPKGPAGGRGKPGARPPRKRS